MVPEAVVSAVPVKRKETERAGPNSGWVDRACGNGFGRGQDGTVLLALISTAVIALPGSLSWIFVVGALRQVAWSARSPRLKQMRAGL